jgi:hypothetical protein
MFRRLVSGAVILSALALSACAEPPTREMSQAQAAIDAARAAGAERYAGEEYAAAVGALQQSRDAVDQRDYRRALDQALDSRERAQAAAKQALDQKAAIRTEVERTLAELHALIEQASAGLYAAQAARVPRRTLWGLHATIAAANGAVQEAGEALSREDYQAAREGLPDVAAQLRAAVADLEAAVGSHGDRPGR